jgi:hypothetical protein
MGRFLGCGYYVTGLATWLLAIHNPVAHAAAGRPADEVGNDMLCFSTNNTMRRHMNDLECSRYAIVGHTSLANVDL